MVVVVVLFYLAFLASILSLSISESRFNIAEQLMGRNVAPPATLLRPTLSCLHSLRLTLPAEKERRGRRGSGY